MSHSLTPTTCHNNGLINNDNIIQCPPYTQCLQDAVQQWTCQCHEGYTFSEELVVDDSQGCVVSSTAVLIAHLIWLSTLLCVLCMSLLKLYRCAALVRRGTGAVAPLKLSRGTLNSKAARVFGIVPVNRTNQQQNNGNQQDQPSYTSRVTACDGAMQTEEQQGSTLNRVQTRRVASIDALPVNILLPDFLSQSTSPVQTVKTIQMEIVENIPENQLTQG